VVTIDELPSPQSIVTSTFPDKGSPTVAEPHDVATGSNVSFIGLGGGIPSIPSTSIPLS
jgi:hypothetical protein